MRLPKLDIQIRPRDAQTPVAVQARPASTRLIPKIRLPDPAPAPAARQVDLSYRGIQLYNAEGEPIPLDAEQQHAVDLAIEGRSFVLIGPAGSGKTTTYQAIQLAYIKHHEERMREVEYRIQGAQYPRLAPSSASVSFTGVVVTNLRNKLLSHPELVGQYGPNICTAHNLLEFAPTHAPAGSGEARFAPRRHKHKKLEITHLGIDEATTIGTGKGQLWNQLYEAMPEGVQLVFMGDINQLPAIGGPAILNYALTQLPVVELKTIYRQAGGSPIIEQAHRVLKGQYIQENWDRESMTGVRIVRGTAAANRKVSLQAFKASLRRLFPVLLDKGEYDPNQDMILIPFDKTRDKHGREMLGAQDINSAIATHIAQKASRVVYEIQTGFNTLYMSVGDYVYYNKRKAKVVKIEENLAYRGRTPQQASPYLNYWGEYEGTPEQLATIQEINFTTDKFQGLNIDALKLANDQDNSATRVQAASHSVTLQYLDEDLPNEVLTSASEMASNTLYLGYAMTIYKAIGSEWRRVYVILHDSHKSMLFRESLYTAMTRPKELCTFIAQEHVLKKCVDNPRIVGDTLEAKLAFFNSGALQGDISFETKN